jgi:hypothetical protein
MILFTFDLQPSDVGEKCQVTETVDVGDCAVEGTELLQISRKGTVYIYVFSLKEYLSINTHTHMKHM